MGECKESVTMRIPSAVRAELWQFAARERRSLGNIGATLLEWAFEQLKVAGSTERLLQYRIRPSVKQPEDSRPARHKP
jgi:hypothetical protein